MPTPTIVRGSDHFSTVIYEGNGAGQRVGSFIPFTDNGTIGKSILSNPGDDPILTYDISGETATSADKWTFSAWVKRTGTGSTQYFAGTSIDGNTETKLGFDTSDRAYWVNTAGGSVTAQMISNRTFEDTSKWYHFVWSMDSTQSTAANRARLYVDGDEITSWSTATYITQNNDYVWTTGDQQRINWGATEDLNGYMAEINNVDGQQLGPDTFGVTDTSTGRWIPKSLGSITYGNTGYRLTFANGAGQTIGDDTSGNGHDFTVSNFTVSDVSLDSPTSNFTNMRGSFDTGSSIQEGGLKAITAGSGSGYNQIVGLAPFGVATGKWYWEVRVTDNSEGIIGWKDDGSNGGSQASYSGSTPPGNISGICCGSSGSFSDGELSIDTGYSGPDLGTTNNNDIFMFALDLDNQRAYIGQNGSWLNSDNPETPTAGVGGLSRIGSGNKMYPAIARLDASMTGYYNFGQNPSFNGGITAGTETPDSGPGVFKYNPPTGYLAINQDNLPTPDKDISDFVWIKSRDTASAHMLFDSSRGSQLRIKSDSTSSETTSQGTVTKFLKGGFAVGDQTSVNKASDSTVAWMWHANGGTTATNNDGSQTSTTQVNTTSGFSIVTYAGTSSGTATIGHGLSSTPEWIVIKNLTDSRSWFVYHKDLSGANYYLNLNSTSAQAVGDVFNNTAPTSSVFSIQDAGSLNTNGSGKNYLALCWHGVEGYSKFGSYKGNGSSNGTFINLGFKPAVIITKNISGSYRWNIIDNKRDPFNPAGRWLAPDNTDDEDAYTGSYPHDFLSNGFKLRANTTVLNNNNNTFVYAAFAEHPFIGDGTNPCTAR